VLTSVLPVVEASKHVRTDEARLVDVAGWLAYEELPMPQFLLPFRPAGDRGDVIDFILLCASINFAFTDFTTRTKFEVEYAGQLWSDSDALFACVGRAMVAGDDLGNGRRLSTITAQQLDGIFAGNIPTGERASLTDSSPTSRGSVTSARTTGRRSRSTSSRSSLSGCSTRRSASREGCASTTSTL